MSEKDRENDKQTCAFVADLTGNYSGYFYCENEQYNATLIIEPGIISDLITATMQFSNAAGDEGPSDDEWHDGNGHWQSCPQPTHVD